MIVSSKINSAEMREAFRMNLTPAFWWKVALGNTRVLLYLVIVIVILFTTLMRGGPIRLSEISILLGVAAFLIGLFLLRLHRIIEKTGKTLNASSNTLAIDAQGLTAEALNGTRTFVPWSALKRWREGKLVYTIGDAKAFRAVSKSTLGEMQSGELRSLLFSHIQSS